MNKFANSLSKKLDTKVIRRVKMLILFVFICLIGLDIFFVMPNKYPTISQVVMDSSPKWFVLIWLFGLAVTNIFFQKHDSKKTDFKVNLIVLGCITLLFTGLGFAINQPEATINCKNYRNIIAKYEIPFVTRVLCQDLSAGLTERKNIDCKIMNCTNDVQFKIDLTVQVKFIIFLLGIFLGYYLWPSKHQFT